MVVMMVVVMTMMPLMAGDDAIDGDGGRGAVTGARASVWQCGCTPLYFRKKIKSTLNLPKHILFVNTSGSVSGDDDGCSVDNYGVDGGCGCVGGDGGGDSGDDYGVDGGGGRVGVDDSGGVDDGGGGFVCGGDDGGDGCYDYGGDDGGGDDDGSGGDDAIDGW